MLEDDLAELHRKVDVLQQLVHDDRDEARELLPRLLQDAKQSIEGLRAAVAALAAPAPPHRETAEAHTYRLRLRALMADLLVAEERERRRLAIDLHDGLSQTIALAQIKLSALRAVLDGSHTGELDEVEALIAQANQGARSISFELSPPILHDLGLGPALQWLVENIHARYGLDVLLEDDGEPGPADETTRVVLFRSIRELLINAAKHACATRVVVSVVREHGWLHAVVEDDGVGMGALDADTRGSGLFSVHERLSHVGGSVHIDSAPGRGTTIHLNAPLAAERAARQAVVA